MEINNIKLDRGTNPNRLVPIVPGEPMRIGFLSFWDGSGIWGLSGTVPAGNEPLLWSDHGDITFWGRWSLLATAALNREVLALRHAREAEGSITFDGWVPGGCGRREG